MILIEIAHGEVTRRQVVDRRVRRDERQHRHDREDRDREYQPRRESRHPRARRLRDALVPGLVALRPFHPEKTTDDRTREREATVQAPGRVVQRRLEAFVADESERRDLVLAKARQESAEHIRHEHGQRKDDDAEPTEKQASTP